MCPSGNAHAERTSDGVRSPSSAKKLPSNRLNYMSVYNNSVYSRAGFALNTVLIFIEPFRRKATVIELCA